MRVLRSIIGKKIIAISLLMGLCVSMISPVFADNGRDASRKYADWLRSQLGSVTSEAVELALAEALETEAESLDAFIEVFVDAYALASLDQEPAAVTRVVLAALQHHRSHLVDSAVTPNLLLKSALVRTLSSQDRANPGHWKAFERVAAIEMDRHLASTLVFVVSHFSIEPGTLISPRGP